MIGGCTIQIKIDTAKMELLKDKINDHATHSKNKNTTYLCGGINERKKGYQLKSNLVKNENGDLSADSLKSVKM
jgi:pseudouridine-5'-phosphate glycosidase